MFTPKALIDPALQPDSINSMNQAFTEILAIPARLDSTAAPQVSR
jgi:hypothetical protein